MVFIRKKDKVLLVGLIPILSGFLLLQTPLTSYVNEDMRFILFIVSIILTALIIIGYFYYEIKKMRNK